MSSAEEEVVRSIRCDNGVDEDLVRDAKQNPALWQTLQNLKLKLAKALDVLSDELYSKPAHFVLEVIQNATDNSYAPGSEPELRFVLRGSYMETECNEVGFTAENVRAFCGIGQSTKKNKAGYIGEKGIGAKSMFKVARTVSVHSNGFHFVLDRDQELGMISPQWLSNASNRPGWTLMRLDFCDNQQFTSVKTQLVHVRDSVLLFLDKLSRLTVDDGAPHPFTVSRTVRGNLVTITTAHDKISHRRYVRVAQTIPAYGSEPKRVGAQSTEIILAFPLNKSGQPLAQSQMVHAFLPMRSYGFKFIIQADFLTAANREDVLSDLQWNKAIRDSIATVFLTAFDDFRQMEDLVFTWPRFLPDSSSVVDTFFAPVTRLIKQRLVDTPCVMCENGEYRRPSGVRFLSSFAVSGASLIPEQYLPFRYVSKEYPQDVRTHLRHIGVQEMTFGDFLGGLVAMGDAITKQENEWLEEVCSVINTHGFKRQRQKFVPTDNRLLQLPLARLPSGLWLHGASANSLFFDSRQSRFPAGLNINVMHHDSKSPEREKLLTRLGVRNVDADVVVGKIFNLHRTNNSAPTLSAAMLLEHVLYVFEKRRDLRTTRIEPDSLYFVDDDNYLRRGNELYMDSARPNATRLSELFEAPARFIHSDYISPESLTAPQRTAWTTWLKGTFGVATSPRFANGRPAPEFYALIERLRTADPARLLLVLREYWDDIVDQDSWGALHYFSSVRIRCRNGAVVELRSTYLLSSSLSAFATDDMPQLPVEKPDAPEWNFLRKLGVSTEINASFFLKRLVALAQTKSATPTIVKTLYKQLEARFHEIPSEIRTAFRDNSLFFIRNNWSSKDAVVWDGPTIMTQKVALKRIFPSLEELFRTHLAIPDAHPTIVADELMFFYQSHGRSNLTKDDQATVLTLLEYGADTVDAINDGSCTDWTKNLRYTPILPVAVPGTTRVTLESPGGRYFLPDPTGELEELFSQHLPFIAASPSRLVTLQPLLELFGAASKQINKHVTQEILVNGVALELASDVGVRDQSASAFYSSRIPYLQRVQHFRRATAPFVRTINVISVKRIDAIYNVDVPDASPVQQSHGCWVKGNADGELGLFLSSSSQSSSRSKKSTVLSSLTRALGLGTTDKALIHNILFSDDAEDVKDLLRDSGVLELDPETAARILPVFPTTQPEEPSESVSSEWTELFSKTSLQSSSTSFTFSAPAFSTPNTSPFRPPNSSGQQHRKKKSQARPSHGRRSGSGSAFSQAMIDTAAADEGEADLGSYVNSDLGRQEIRSLSVVAQSVGLPRASFRGPNSQGGLRRPRISSPETSPTSTQRRSHQDERGKQVGFLGERFVYELLQNLLPDDFGHENWTSELRVHAGFPPFEGEELADFQYRDTSGALTRALFASEPDLMDARPEYLIEVKSTSGGQSEPFHMKRRQFLQALQATRSIQAGEPERLSSQVYVLFRVSGISNGGNPTLRAYVDPHDLLARGMLRIESESVEVRVVADE
ncbi:hypothetical protein EXIGLDRAFT_842290 [Exidia glandulosa HHB12029]|uniref:Protein NO VEIN C-terminal domain-containing protein n=1 Tax=Exidia glandulosa HHB12029 TaxID=1314781 RepID=A0A165ZND1_EXIGL|nr:hypothetical protein EXIGLDRAFT_842290 [Exidia glandulosa HHB12029]